MYLAPELVLLCSMTCMTQELFETNIASDVYLNSPIGDLFIYFLLKFPNVYPRVESGPFCARVQPWTVSSLLPCRSILGLWVEVLNGPVLPMDWFHTVFYIPAVC